MRPMLALVMTLCACTPAPQTDASRAETCRAAFQSYDRAVAFERPGGFLQLPIPGSLDAEPAGSFARSRIQQLGCVSFPREVPDPSTLDLGRFAAVPGAPAARQYLHVGILSSNSTEGALRATFEALGYPVRVKGAELLGRRFFVGPLATDAEQSGAIGAARSLGFDAAYFLTRVP